VISASSRLVADATDLHIKLLFVLNNTSSAQKLHFLKHGCRFGGKTQIFPILAICGNEILHPCGILPTGSALQAR